MIAALLHNMLLTSLVLLVLLLVRRPVAALFGAGWAYALWLLVPLRLLLPPLPALETDFLPSPTMMIPLSAEAAAPLPPDGGSGQWVPVLLAAWAGGAVVLLLWQWLAYRRFLTALSLSSTSLGAHRRLPLIECTAVDGPLAVGLLDRRIVVPADFFTRYAPEERRLALEHEWVHHRRGDIWWNLVALLVLALNWFNPLAWIAFRAFRTDQELACDAAVAASASPEDRHHYARALVKSASRPGLVAACPLNHADQLKRRLKMMKTHRTSRLRSVGGLAALGVAIVATAAFGTPGLAQEQGERRVDPTKRGEQIMVIRHEGSGEGPSALRIRRGPNGEFVAPEGCSGGEALANVDERSGERRMRVLLCGRGEQTAEQRLEALQQARSRFAGNDVIGAEHRDRLLQALDREIARLRGQ